MEQTNQRRIQVQNGGRRKIPFLERKVMCYGYVKRMYSKEVQNKINELLKQYR